MNELSDHAGEIRRHHESAEAAATVAVEHALAAGQLLHDAKQRIDHGQFENWVRESCGLSVRNAQRYMRLHRHRETLPEGVGIKAALEHIKSDTVSYLANARHMESRVAELLRELSAFDVQLQSLESDIDDGQTTYERAECAASISFRGFDIERELMDIRRDAQQRLSQMLHAPDVLHDGRSYANLTRDEGWLPATEAAITFELPDKAWIVWRDSAKCAHVLELHFSVTETLPSVTAQPVPTSNLRATLNGIGLGNPDNQIWWRFSKKGAIELRNIVIETTGSQSDIRNEPLK